MFSALIAAIANISNFDEYIQNQGFQNRRLHLVSAFPALLLVSSISISSFASHTQDQYLQLPETLPFTSMCFTVDIQY